MPPLSVAYKKREPKHLLLKSKPALCNEFLSKNEDINVKKSVLMRDFPRNFVTPTCRDLQRNVCPYHANLRHLLSALHSKNAARFISKSCQGVAFVAMCQSNGSDPMDPLTWDPKCALGECPNCPDLHVDTDECISDQVQVNIWRKGTAGVDANGKDKEIFTLFLDTLTLTDAVSSLQKMATMMKTHIFVAHRQWQFNRSITSKLSPMNSIVTVEDYQQNAEVMLDESPTETNFGKNKIQLAIYPIHSAFKLSENGPVKYSAITFIR